MVHLQFRSKDIKHWFSLRTNMSNKYEEQKRSTVSDKVLNASSATHGIDMRSLYDGTFSNYGVLDAVKLDDKEDFRRFVIVDSEFVDERLRVADKHLRDYGNLPDKGQFPFMHQDGDKAVYDGTVSFFGSVDENEKSVVVEN